jgi:hypothetical protein
MGFFSKTCAKTHLPICASVRNERLSKVVVLYPDGKKLEGEYDGYGRVNGEELCPDGYDHKLWNKLKFVWQESYNGETYKELGKSHDELAQGYFMDTAFIRHCLLTKGFKDYSEYKKYMKKLGNWI